MWLTLFSRMFLSAVFVSLALVLLPASMVGRVKVIMRIRLLLLRRIRRAVRFFTQGPPARAVAFCGRRCCCGYLSSRCQAPTALKVTVTGCDEVMLGWAPAVTYNPFHEETYVCAWRRAGEVEDEEAASWHEWPVLGEDVLESSSAKRWRTFLRGLPQQARVRLRVRAVCRRFGPGPWGEEVEALTLAHPNADYGFTGPLGPAGGGGSYVWEQTKTSVAIKVPIAQDWKSRDIKFKVKPSRLEIFVVGPTRSEPEELLVGTFPKCVTADEVFWEIDTCEELGRHVLVQMKKASQMQKWPCLLEGDAHPHIDTRFVRFFTKEAESGFDIYE